MPRREGRKIVTKAEDVPNGQKTNKLQKEFGKADCRGTRHA